MGGLVSIGIGPNILLARLATRRAKPAGSHHFHSPLSLSPTAPETLAYIHELDVQSLPGFGRSARDKVQSKFGSSKLGDLYVKSKDALVSALGKVGGEKLYDAVRGADNGKIESDKPRRSVSCEINVRAFLYFLHDLTICAAVWHSFRK
jgi:DNA repair protein REV1